MARAVLINKPPIKTVLIEDANYSNVQIKHPIRGVTINEILPFRIKFTNIMVPGFNASTVPAIPLQVIGYSNYIL